ncbi:MAG: ISL3 family transposase [Planctomycetota bacterium]
MRVTTLFNKLLHLQGLWVIGFYFLGEDLVLRVQPRRRRLTCPHCGVSRTGKVSERQRRWRHLGIWSRVVWIEGPIRRLFCRQCDRTVTEAVPWARHDSDFTRPFEDAVGLMAQRTDHTAVSQLFAISWVTVGSIARRLVDELLDPERLTNLRRIAVDEISFRKRHRYLTVVTDHDTGDVVWAAEGQTSDVLKAFFRSLPPGVCEAIEVVTMDMSAAYQKAVRDNLPNAVIAFDHFHIVKLANEALNEVRRELSREVRATDPDLGKAVKGMRWPTSYALENLPERQVELLGLIRPQSKLGRAYLLKEQLREVLRQPSSRVTGALRSWIAWASRSRLAPFVRLGRTIRKCLPGIVAFVQHRLTNALAEGTNNKIRLISHRAFGFHSAPPLIATVYLCCGGIKLTQPLHLL